MGSETSLRTTFSSFDFWRNVNVLDFLKENRINKTEGEME